MPNVEILHHPRRLALAAAGVVLLVAELNAAANSSIKPKTEIKPACAEPTPNAILIPLAHPGDDKVELIPLAHPGDDKVELIPLAPGSVLPPCPIILES